MIILLLCESRQSINAVFRGGNHPFNRLVVKIPQTTRPISHNAPFHKRHVYPYVHCCYKMLHHGIFALAILDLCDWIIRQHSSMHKCFMAERVLKRITQKRSFKARCIEIHISVHDNHICIYVITTTKIYLFVICKALILISAHVQLMKYILSPQ